MSIVELIKNLEPKTRRIVIVCTAVISVVAIAGVVTIVVALARHDGLEGLYRLLEAVL